MDWIDQGERCSLEELRALQLARLRQTLDHAFQGNRAYRAKCEAAGVDPTTLKALADLSRFPLTTKEDLRQAYPFGFFVSPMHDIARIHASSGTTGRPTVVGYSKRDIELWSALVARSIRAAGGRAGMKVHIAYGYGLFTGGLGAHYGAERLGCTVIPVSGGQTERQVQLICDFEPDIIMVTPSYMLAILDEFRRQGVDPRATSLKIGIFGAEPWSDAMRVEIEQAFGIDAVDIYGLSEVIGPGVANECVETKDGPTIWEDHFYPEVIDPDTGAVLPEGEEGELVFTSLTKQAMPIIRYRTRDITRLLPGTARPHLRRMARITGRSDDMLIIRGVNLFPGQIEEHILAIKGLAPHYVLEVTRPDRLDELKIIVETRHTDVSGIDLANELEHRVKQRTGVTAAVSVVAAGTLPRSSGKASRLRDLRTK